MEMKNSDIENVDYRSRPRIQTLDNIAQSLPLGQLGKCHADELLPASKMSDSRLRIVEFYQAVEGLAMHKIENLGQDEAAGIHAPACLRGFQNSNASHRFCYASPSVYDFSRSSSVS